MNNKANTFELVKELLQKKLADKRPTDTQWEHFRHVCDAKNLDPLQNQITIQMRWNKRTDSYDMAIITQIDGYRLVADRTDKYAGSDNPVYQCTENGSPLSAAVTVYKMVEGQRCGFSGIAYWNEYDAKTLMWGKMPHLMLAKCAEALALRKAFPAELSGIYTDTEMEQANNEDVPHAPQDPPQLPKKSAAPPEPQPPDLDTEKRAFCARVEAHYGCPQAEAISKITAAIAKREFENGIINTIDELEIIKQIVLPKKT